MKRNVNALTKVENNHFLSIIALCYIQKITSPGVLNGNNGSIWL